MDSITIGDLRHFHTIDRKIFARLVLHLMRDPGQSLLVVALWLWLEKMTYSNFVVKLLGQSDDVVNALADEASSCLRVLGLKIPILFPPNGGMPLSRTITGKRNISFQMICNIKYTAITEIKMFLNNVCAFIFTDILQMVLADPTAKIPNLSLVIPGFPSPTFGSVTIIPQSQERCLPSRVSWGWSKTVEVPASERTIFLTFSRGYPVTRSEVWELFTSHFGDCVERVEMDEFMTSGSIQQPLYARMVVSTITTMDNILRGRHVAKFQINRKHVWARKYEPRDTLIKSRCLSHKYMP